MSESVVRPIPSAPGVVEYSATDRILFGKVSVRILTFLFLLMVFSFLDRINIGFAGITMAQDLKLSGTAFGAASGIFYLTYILSGIPSNLMLDKVGPRRWIALLCVVWGLLSSATMFAHDFKSLCILRALVGIAEGGFLPGMFLYMSRWFPSDYRARASAAFLIAMPVTSVLGSLLSGYLLRFEGIWGLAGWQWVFLCEGAPAIVLGFLTYFYLTERPADAAWLEAGEKSRLAEVLTNDRRIATESQVPSIGWRSALTAPILLLAAFYFCLVNSLNLVSMWVPQILKSFDQGLSGASISLLLAIPHACTVALMLIWSLHSDFRRERKWHLFAAVGLAVLGWLLVAYGGDSTLRLTGIALASGGANAAMAIFWTVPERVMSIGQQALGLAIISSVGNVGSAVSPVVVGIIRDVTHSFNGGILYAIAALLVGGAILILAPSLFPRRAT